MPRAKKRIVLQTKTYTVTHTLYSDGTVNESRACDGFNPWELLGIFRRITREINQQMDKEISPPEKVRRVAVV